MDDNTNKIELPRTATDSFFQIRGLDEADPMSPHRVTAMAKLLDSVIRV